MSVRQDLQPLADDLTIMRRVRPADVTHDSDGNPRPISSVFRQGGPHGDVSVYLTSETTAEVITRDHPGTLLVELTIAEVRTQGLDVQREEIPGDPGHCNPPGNCNSQGDSVNCTSAQTLHCCTIRPPARTHGKSRRRHKTAGPVNPSTSPVFRNLPAVTKIQF